MSFRFIYIQDISKKGIQSQHIYIGKAQHIIYIYVIYTYILYILYIYYIYVTFSLILIIC